MMNNFTIEEKSFNYICSKFYQICYRTQDNKEHFTKGIMLNYHYRGIELLTEDGILRVRMGDIKEIIPIKNLSSKIDSFQEIINDFKNYNENYKTEDNVENTSAAAQKNGYWINILPSEEVPGTIRAAMATSKTGVANINGKEVSFKVALANYKGKPVKVMEVYRSGRKHGCIVSEDLGKVMHLANKSGVIYIDEEDIELGKNKVRVSIIA